jgi:hypothetical protein
MAKKKAKPARAPDHDIRAKKLAKQITDNKLRKQRVPKIGDRVAIHGQNGRFVVSSVDKAIGNVMVRLIGRDLALDMISWDALTYLDELDESQNVAPDRERRNLT